MKTLKEDSVVMVYENFITKDNEEGEARLMKLQYTRPDDNIEVWAVQFLDEAEGDWHTRAFKLDDE